MVAIDAHPVDHTDHGDVSPRRSRFIRSPQTGSSGAGTLAKAARKRRQGQNQQAFIDSASQPMPPAPTLSSGTKSQCRREVEQAVVFVGQLVRPVLPDYLLDQFLHHLAGVLTARFAAHWYPEDPYRGSGFRSISVTAAAAASSTKQIDPVLLAAWADTVASCPNQLPPGSAAALRQLDASFMIWIDPGEVTVRMGEDGPTWPLWQQHFDEGHPLCQRMVPVMPHRCHAHQHQIPDPATDSDSGREGGWSSTSESDELEMINMPGSLSDLSDHPAAERSDSARLSHTAAAFTPKISSPININNITAPAIAIPAYVTPGDDVGDSSKEEQDEAVASSPASSWDGSSSSTTSSSWIKPAVLTTSGAAPASAESGSGGGGGEAPRRQSSRGKYSTEKRPNKYQRRRRGSRKKDTSALPGIGPRYVTSSTRSVE